MVEKAVSTFGRLDAAVEKAGIQSPAVETADVTGDVFDRIDGINLRGVWSCMKYERLQMRTQKSGAIVNCSSLGGLVGVPGRAAYMRPSTACFGDAVQWLCRPGSTFVIGQALAVDGGYYGTVSL